MTPAVAFSVFTRCGEENGSLIFLLRRYQEVTSPATFKNLIKYEGMNPKRSAGAGGH